MLPVLFLMVCLHVVSRGLSPRCFSWSVSTLFLVVCLHVVSHGLPPIAPWDRAHCLSNVDHLFSHLVDLTVLRICNLSDVDNNVLYQSGFFIGLENILCRTLQQLVEVYGLNTHLETFNKFNWIANMDLVF